MDKDTKLDDLIRLLSPDAAIPADTEAKWRLFHALVNTREPKPVNAEYLTAEDGLLQSIIARKGITDVGGLFPVRDNICLWRGDITTLKAGAIVNAANSGMLGCFAPNHGCIDNAIHTFAGVRLRLECASIMEKQGYPEPTGQAKITKAYNLPCDYVLHTVGPIITGELSRNDCDLLASCYRSCLELAEEHGINSIAFCCVSTGEFSFPNERAAEIAIKTVDRYIAEKHSGMRVVFNVFKELDHEIYKRLLRAS